MLVGCACCCVFDVVFACFGFVASDVVCVLFVPCVIVVVDGCLCAVCVWGFKQCVCFAIACVVGRCLLRWFCDCYVYGVVFVCCSLFVMLCSMIVVCCVLVFVVC